MKVDHLDFYGKRSIEQLEDVEENHFDSFEVYLKEEDVFENFEERLLRIEKLDNSKISCFHTPHVRDYDRFQESIYKCDKLASASGGASIVVHSLHIKWNIIKNKVDINFDIENEYGLENYIGFSTPAIERYILHKHNLVLDIAHLYMTNPQFYQKNLSHIIDNYSKKISDIHLCDSTEHNDGVDIGKGNINILWSLEKIVNSNYDGGVTIEVPVEDQKESYEDIINILEHIDR